MSQTLDLLSSAASQISNVNSLGSAVAAIGSISQLFVGNGPIVLGQFQFDNFEIPSSVDYGGGQRVVHHDYPGGGRSASIMGRDDRNITWSGSLLSADAISRSQTLDQIRTSGQPQALSFGSNYFEVVVENLSLTFRQPNWIDYQISCWVLSINPNTSKPSLLQAVTDDIGSALGINLPSTLSAVTPALQAVQTAVQAVTSLTGGSSAALSILGSVTSAQTIVNGLTQAANGQISSLTVALGAVTGASAAAGKITSLTSAAWTLAAGTSVKTYLGRIANNLTGGL
jgi:hypothetical protein